MSSIWTVRRGVDDAKVAGVCAGIARHWGVDPTVVRVGCAVLALSGGVGLVLYLAGALLIPAEGKDRAVIDDVLGDRARTMSRETWIVVVVAACVAAMVALSQIAPITFWPVVVLALVWYFGYYKNRPRSQSSAPPPPPAVSPPEPFRYPGQETPFTRAAEAWQRRVAEQTQPPRPTQPAEPSGLLPDVAYAAAAARSFTSPPDVVQRDRFFAVPDPVGLYQSATPDPGDPVVPVPVAAASSAARSRPARRLRLAWLAALLVTVGSLGVAAGAGVAVPVATYFAAALLVSGVTLLLAAWLGRARGILPVALLLLLATVAATAAGPVGRAVEQSVTPVSYNRVADLPTGVDRQQFGARTVDLSRLRVDGDRTYAAEVRWGLLEVIPPANTQLRIRYRVSSGTVLVAGQEIVTGDALEGVVEPVRKRPGSPTLTLDLTVEYGEIKVR